MVQTPSVNDTFFGLDISGARKTYSSFRRKISKRFLLIEFGEESLTYGEARVIKDQVYCSKLNRISIDKTAIERGTPTDSDAMASFLSQIIEEEQIWAHRVAITLPPQAALSKLIYLPAHLNYKEAIEYVSNPSSSGFQFPISIENTDFDLIPLDCLPLKDRNQTKPYFLNSVPKRLIDNIINTLSDADLELHSLDISYSSLERLAITSINNLKNNQVIILIELSLECTHFYIISSSGPIYISTLAAIRAFEAKEDYQGEKSIEEDTINSEDYLAISKLDLKVLLNEVTEEIDKFKRDFNLEICEIFLSGVNSSHPNINNYFKERLEIKTSILRPLESTFIGDINLSKPIVLQDLNRIIGLGLSMIQADSLVYEGFNNSSANVKTKNIFQDKSLKKTKPNEIDIIIQDKSNLSEDYSSQSQNNNSNNKNLPEFIKEDGEEEIAIIDTKNISFDDFLKQNNNGEITKFNSSNYLVKDETKLTYYNSNSGNIKISSTDKNSEIEITESDNKELTKDDEIDRKDSSLLEFDTNIENKKISSTDKNSEIETTEYESNDLTNKNKFEEKSDSNQRSKNIENDEFTMP